MLLWVAATPFLLFPQRQPVPASIAALALLGAYLFGRRWLPPSVFDLPLLIYLSLATVALLLAPAPPDSLRRLTTLFLGVTGYRGLVSLPALREKGLAVTTGVGVLPMLGTGVALVGLVTARWPARYLLDLQALTGRLPHLGGGFSINHNQLAGALVLLLLPGIFSWRRVRSQTYRALLGAALLLMMVVLLLTQSRNGILSLALGLVGGLLWQRGRFRLLLALFLLLLLLPLLVGALPPEIGQPFGRSLDALDGGSKAGPAADQSWLARLEMWSAAIRLLGDYPVLGAGLYTFESTSRANEIYHSIRPDIAFSHAHNLWLQTGAGLGWPGWLAAVLLWSAVLVNLARATRAAPRSARWPGVALAASLCGYFTFNTFDVLALEQRAGLLVWLLLALVGVFVRHHSSRPLPARNRHLHLAPLLLLLFLLPWLPRNLANLQLDRARLANWPDQLPADTSLATGDYRRLGLLRALQGREKAALQTWQLDPQAIPFLEKQGLRAYFQEEDAAAALQWYGWALVLDPAAATVYYWQGEAYDQLGWREEALRSFRRAVVHGQGQTLFGRKLPALAWEQQGRILARSGEWQAAGAAFATALALEPEVGDYRQQLEEIQQALAEREAQQRRRR